MFRFRLPKRDEVLRTWPLNYLAEYLAAPGLWAFRRHSVSYGVAWGLFCAWLPIPFQMVVASVGCLLWHINLPVALACVWVTNPITIPLMLYLAFIVGDALVPSGASLSLADFKSADQITELFYSVLEPTLIGCFILGCVTAALGFFSARLFWFMWMRRRWLSILKVRELKRLLHIDERHRTQRADRKKID